MGCGLRKLEDPDDSSPGKIFSTLKRPQVETKTEFAYEYVLLDFTLQGTFCFYFICKMKDFRDKGLLVFLSVGLWIFKLFLIIRLYNQSNNNALFLNYTLKDFWSVWFL